MTTYRTPVFGEELLRMSLENPVDARQYLDVLELRHLLPQARAKQTIVPAILLGLLNVAPRITVADAYRDWQYGEDSGTMLVAGQHASANLRHTLTEEQLRRALPPGHEAISIYSQIAADNTPDQAVWLCNIVRQHDIKAVAVRVPWFHVPRAYLTIVGEMAKQNFFFDLLPWPEELDPEMSYPFAGFSDRGKNIELLPAEFKRFIDYRGKGVATHEVANWYIRQIRDNYQND
jgi:hypothetical protein